MKQITVEEAKAAAAERRAALSPEQGAKLDALLAGLPFLVSTWLMGEPGKGGRQAFRFHPEAVTIATLEVQQS